VRAPAPPEPAAEIGRSTSVEATRALGRALAADLAPDGALLLTGELGAGKTALVQGLAEGLGIDAAEVQSPTFTLAREHRGAGGARLVHLDLYRLDPEQVAAAGFEELLLGGGVKAVEWAERLPFEVPGAATIEIVREPGPEGVRRIHRLAPGELARRRG
jgi:tRNA threonylcarbamoyladenosine biosynthesis protein TsaE